MDLKELGEFGLISRLTQNSLYNSDEVVLGVGDDSAVLPLDEENYLLAACDMLVENIHFILNKCTPFQLGYKAVAVNFSDIAAMGGWPTGILISVGFPSNTSLSDLDQLYNGIKEICQKYKVNIIGGDTVVSPRGWVINISVLGKVKKEKLRLRSQAQVGDIVVVTGSLGDSAAGLELILTENDKVEENIKNKLLKKHLEPEPCLAESKIFNTIDGLHALDDISDGLVSEATEIAQASRVGIELHAEKIPLSAEANQLGKILNKNPLDWALYGGEDFQLLATIKKDSLYEIKNIFKKADKTLYEIGVVTKETGVFLLKNQRRTLITTRGYNHFA